MNRNIAIGITGGIILIMAISLFGWYLFVYKQQARNAAVNQGRGFDTAVPTFSGDGTGRVATPARVAPIITSGAHSSDASSTSVLPTLSALQGVSTGPESFFSENGTMSARFVDARNGNIYETNVQTGTPARLTNTLVPGVGDVIWVGTDRVILRTVDDAGHIASFDARIVRSASSTVGTLVGTYLEPDLISIVASPAGDALARLAPIENGVALLVSKPDGSTAKRIWTSLVHGWMLSWVTTHVLVAQQKASMGVVGSAYVIDATTGTTSPLVVNVAGLTLRMSPITHAVLYSESYKEKTTLFVRSLASTTPIALPYTTLAEKCVWSTVATSTVYCAVPKIIPTESEYPDDWYRGELHTSDRWFKINTETQTGELFLDPENEFRTTLDVQDPIMDPQGRHILFTDAKTGTPWILNVGTN